MRRKVFNKITAWLTAVCVLAGMLVTAGKPTAVYAEEPAPWGSEMDGDTVTYLIYDEEDLIALSDELNAEYWESHFKLMDDLDLSPYNWTPIGAWDNWFTGSFDGQEYTISGLKIDNIIDDIEEGAFYAAGLFGALGTGSELTNIRLDGININSSNNHLNYYLLAGGLAGYSEGIVSNSSCTGSIIVSEDSAAAGGLVGWNGTDGDVNGSYSACEITAGGSYVNAGGLIGQNDGHVNSSYSRGRVAGGDDSHVGGLVANFSSSWGSIDFCYSIANVSGGAGALAGGLIGLNGVEGAVNSSYYISETSGEGDGSTGEPRTAEDLKLRTTFTEWDFDDIWKIGEYASYPTLQWQAWTADEEITADKYELTWDDIRNTNGSENNVTADLADLNQITSGARGTTIGWSVPPGQGWLTASGTVTRPTALEGTQVIVLTAAIRKDETEQTKDFTLTIREEGITVDEEITLDYDALSWETIKGENTEQNNITGNLRNPLPTAGANGTTISWRAEPDDPVWIDLQSGVVMRPAYDQVDAVVTLYATVSKEGGDDQIKSFPLRIKAAEMPADVAIGLDAAALDWEEIKGDNQDEQNVTTSLNLIRIGANGTEISWNASPEYWIDTDTGEVTRPIYSDNDRAVTLSAIVSKEGGAPQYQTFNLIIKAEEMTDEIAINADAIALNWNVIKNINSAANNVTTDLVNPLPTAGANGTDISWSVSSEGWIDTITGEITRPTSEGNQAVTLTATVSKGIAAPRTVVFNLTIIAAEVDWKGAGTQENPYQVATAEHLNNVRNYLDERYVYFVQKANITLPTVDEGESNWEPIGDLANSFDGTFYGNGHTISGLTIYDPNWAFVGLFGYTDFTAKLNNIRLENVNIYSATHYVNMGALVGANAGAVSGCSSTGTVTGGNNAYIGGLVGGNNGSVDGCYSTAAVSGEVMSYAGGLVGRNSSNISSSYSTGKVASLHIESGAYTDLYGRTAGGLAGSNSSSGTITCSHSSGLVIGATNIENASASGGLVGSNSGAISGSFYNRQTAGQSDTGKGESKTTAEMKQEAAFTAAGWDFASTWRIIAGKTYPYLGWQISGTDKAPPLLSEGYPQTAGEPAYSSFTLEACADEPSIAYYVVLTDGAPTPTAIEVKNGTGNEGEPAVKYGSIALATAGVPATIDVTGLTPGTSYDIYLTLEDAAGNLQVRISDKIEADTAALSLESIAVTNLPDQTTYYVGESLDLTGLTVTGTYIDSSFAQLTITMANISGFNSSTAVTGQIVTVSYEGRTATFTVDIVASSVVSAAISPETGSFDKNPASRADVSTVITWNDASSVTDVKKDGISIGAGYAVSGNTLTIRKEYLAALPTGNLVLEVEFDTGNAAALTITVQDTTFAEPDPPASPGGGGGGGTPVPPSAATVDANGNITVAAKLDRKTGVAAAEVDAATLNTAFGKTVQGSEGTKTVPIAIPGVEGAKAYEPTLPASALSSSDTGTELEIKTGIASVTLPGDMLELDTAADVQKVSLTVAQTDTSDIDSEDTKNRIGDRPVIQLSLKLDGKPYAWSNEDSPVTVSIPYKPTPEELADPEHITVWYLDGRGNVVEVPSGRYDPATGTVTFSTTHFSNFAVAYVTKTFRDLGRVSWAKKPIEVLASKGILKGVSETEYAPQTNITRADFLYYLIRTLGVDAKTDGNFDDIDKDAYYYRETAIAKKLGITGGTGNNKFTPDAGITRQDMMVMTERALRMLKRLETQSTAADLDQFADKSLVAAYAVNSIASVVKEGLITGSGGKVNPRGNTTRAEAAVFLHRIYNNAGR